MRGWTSHEDTDGSPDELGHETGISMKDEPRSPNES
jgi:hypothetical protein